MKKEHIKRKVTKVLPLKISIFVFFEEKRKTLNIILSDFKHMKIEIVKNYVAEQTGLGIFYVT